MSEIADSPGRFLLLALHVQMWSQYARIPPEAVLRSLELTGRELIPAFEPLGADA